MANEFIEGLHAERVRAVNEQRSIVEKALTEERSTLSAEEQAHVDRLDAAIDSKDAEIRSWQDRDARDKEAEEARSQYAEFVRPEVVAKSFEPTEQRSEFEQLIAGDRRTATIDLAAAAHEKQILRSGGELRDLLKSSDTALVPTEYARTLIDFMDTYSGVRRAGARVMTTSDGNNMVLPRVATHGAAAAAVSEGGALTEGDPTFDTVTLTAWKFGKLVQISSELNRDSVTPIMGFVAEDAGRALGKATGAQYILGDGTTEPEGVNVGFASGKTGAAAVAGVPGFADCIDLMYSLGDEAYRVNASWLTKDSNVAALRKIVDGDGRFLWEPSLMAGEPDTLLGHKVVTDTNVPAFGADVVGAMSFGDFNAGFIIRDVGSVRFEASSDYAFANDLMTYRAIIFSDSAVRDANAVKLFTGGAAA